MQISSKRIGEILIEKGLINQQQLQAALQEQKLASGYLGSILISKGWISERDFLEVLAQQYNIRLVDLNSEQIDMGLTRKLPPTIIKEHNCFPLRQDELSVTVAISNPLDAEAISKLEDAFKPYRVNLVLASEDDIKQAIANYRRHITKDIQKLLKKDKNP